MQIKICGITNLEDAVAAVDCGADMLGFIFAQSSRKVEPAIVKEIIKELPLSLVKVGVFMDQKISEVRETVSFCNLNMVQLHGDESPEYCCDLNYRIIKAFTPQKILNLDQLAEYAVEALMLDKSKGTDIQPEDLWPIARKMTQYGRVILAGSLTPENVAQAIKVVHPYAVDVASGVERETGKKDHRKIEAFIRESRRAYSDITR